MAKRTAPRQPQPSGMRTRRDTAADRSATATIEREPQPDGIARRAYEIYCERGCQDGRDMDDWLQAEQELRKT